VPYNTCTFQRVINYHSREGHKNQYPDRFKGIGDFPGEVKLYLDPDVQPHIDASRKTPISLPEQIKDALDKMENFGVILRVEEPTD
jgi:hypothetical protein